ncbi:MAG: hypothetical protein EZS28_021794 [Streblomastix strix]|uniref:Tyr recombinase domain-containing protein n=1 Tax=Streblomastix strix TaxID=222440 RepID=A0A5J4VJK3_9EUKA|nr:MAG: hypothetical protein EZS28_021794 [Streblomastix strix]
MKEHVNRAATVRKEVRYWKLSQLIKYISKQALLNDKSKLNSEQLMKVSLTLTMVYTVLRMAEVFRAELRVDNIKEGEILIATMTMKKPRGQIEKTLKAAQDRTVCPIRWIWSWLDRKEVKEELKKELVWRNRRKKKIWMADKCSKRVKHVLAEAVIEGCILFELRPNKHGSSNQRKNCDIIRSQGGEAAEPDTIATPLGPLNASNFSKIDDNNNINNQNNQYNNNDEIDNNSNNDNKQCNNNEDADNKQCKSIDDSDNMQRKGNDDANNGNGNKIERE